MDLLYVLKGIIISVIEGITEFLPVSSTGHLIIAGHFLNFGSGEFEKMYMVVIQLGAILAIIWLYRKKLIDLVSAFFKGEKRGRKFVLAILIGMIPAFIFGFLLDDLIEAKLFNVLTVALALIFGAVMMLYFEGRYRNKSKTHGVENISGMQAIKIGLFQVMALWPGMSRSASTIMGGWQQGLDPETAAEYSFFLAIPIMIGASGLKLIKFIGGPAMSSATGIQWLTLLIGFVVSFIVAVIVVRAFMNYIRKQPMRIFAYYRFILAGILLILMLTTGLNA